ncbi:hypothetical protein [Streptomyces sp. CBMA123]|uniref:hypothetical protein n=1 Tax=Streptomyces sp. CBMA123 TaxID=1896313 RepID=UPI0016618D52|nr:hypothetical protein [Streptomyces sp. CBMA123]MBD0692562.1 hypothetical protein [Streptomyces sp. CBMA123]
MTPDATNLATRISGLSREEAFEAVLALDDLLPADTPQDEPARELLAQVEQSPYGLLADVDDLARIMLSAAALTPECRPAAEEALDSVGRKAFVFGVTEIIAVGALVIAGLALVLSKGKAEERTKLELDEDGKLRYESEVVYASGSGLVRALAKLLGRAQQP